MQEVQPHQPEAVAEQAHTVLPACLSPHITLDDLVASLRLEQGEVAAALVKARDSLRAQDRIQQQHEAKQAAAAAALLAAEKAKPKAKPRLLFCPNFSPPSCMCSCVQLPAAASYLVHAVQWYPGSCIASVAASYLGHAMQCNL